MIKNKVGENNDLYLTTCFLISENHSFGVLTDTSPKICTYLEKIFLYGAGLLLLRYTVTRWVGIAGQSEACIYFD